MPRGGLPLKFVLISMCVYVASRVLLGDGDFGTKRHKRRSVSICKGIEID